MPANGRWDLTRRLKGYGRGEKGSYASWPGAGPIHFLLPAVLSDHVTEPHSHPDQSKIYLESVL